MKPMLEKMVFGRYSVSIDGIVLVDNTANRSGGGCFDASFETIGAFAYDSTKTVSILLGGCCDGYLVQGEIRENKFWLYNFILLPGVPRGVLPVYYKHGDIELAMENAVVWTDRGVWLAGRYTKSGVTTLLAPSVGLQLETQSPTHILSQIPNLFELVAIATSEKAEVDVEGIMSDISSDGCCRMRKSRPGYVC